MNEQEANTNENFERLSALQREVLQNMLNTGKNLQNEDLSAERLKDIKELLIQDAFENPRYQEQLQQIKWQHQKIHLLNKN